MRLNGFRCDTCCKEHLLEPTLTFHHVTNVIPDDWYMLWLGKYEDDKEPLLFCSVACVAQWAEKQVIAAVPHIAEHAKLVAYDWVFTTPEHEVDATLDVTLPATDYIKKALEQLGEVPRKRLMQGNWLPGDEE